MNITIEGTQYEIIDVKENLTVADSFVLRANKIGTGNGEAKLYLGNSNTETRDFFGSGFSIPCILLKSDLLKYLDETKLEYQSPEQYYRANSSFPELWETRRTKINRIDSVLRFQLVEQEQISGPRIYAKSNDLGYKIIRELSLPNITYITILKLQNELGEIIFYFRLFADFFGAHEHPSVIDIEQSELLISAASETERKQLVKARIGQGDFRKNLLEQCLFCPVTMISDDRLLVASHIKPWAQSNNFERLDVKNGFIFTPNIDRLFDNGFLSFTNDKKTILSPFLSKLTYSKLGLMDNKIINNLPISGREAYLDYHRQNILKK